jgi:hypothetical protein
MLRMPRTNPKGDGLDAMRKEYAGYRKTALEAMIRRGKIHSSQYEAAEVDFNRLVEDYLDVFGFARSPAEYLMGAKAVSVILSIRKNPGRRPTADQIQQKVEHMLSHPKRHRDMYLSEVEDMRDGYNQEVAAEYYAGWTEEDFDRLLNMVRAAE